MENCWIKFTKQTKIEYNKIKDESGRLKSIPENAREPYNFLN